METSNPSARAKKHGVWLMAWLVLTLIANAIAAVANLGAVLSPQASSLQAIADITPSWALLVLGLAGVANMVFVILLFRWKLWGFYGIVGVAVLAFIVNLIIGIDIVRSLMGFLGPAILYFLMKPRWALFER